MTSLLAWLAVDSRVPTGLYFASDSRKSWADGRVEDDCIKLFAPKNSPDIFAMVGQDITLPERLLPELCDEIDSGVIPAGQMTSMYGRNDWIQAQFSERMRDGETKRSFTVLHGSRNCFGMQAQFNLFVHEYSGEEKIWRLRSEDMATHSSDLTREGTGAAHFGPFLRSWSVQVGKVSRAYFSGFCDALRAGGDSLTGGAPQLLGLGSKGMPMHYGVVTAMGRFYKGVPVAGTPDGIQFRNELFERVDLDGQLLANAQRHAKPS